MANAVRDSNGLEEHVVFRARACALRMRSDIHFQYWKFVIYDVCPDSIRPTPIFKPELAIVENEYSPFRVNSSSSPDTVPCDFWLFPKLKKTLKRKEIWRCQEDMK